MNREPFQNDGPNKAYQRYIDGEGFVPPIVGPKAISEAFRAGWNAQTELQRDRRTRQYAAPGCGFMMLLLAGMMAGLVGIAAFSLPLETVVWENVLMFMAGLALLALFGLGQTRRDNAKARAANETFRGKWGNA